MNKDNGTVIDSIPSRKLDAKAFQYFTTNLGGTLLNNISAEVQILDTSLNAGATWSGNLGSGTTPLGNVTVTYNANIVERGVQAVVAGNSYSSVIKVHFSYSADAGTGPTEAVSQDIWFARGKGIIYNKVQVVGSAATENELVRAQIF